ncbi:MAG: hypothetical protein AAF525_14580, partial [Pseudomonadota bacterium]
RTIVMIRPGLIGVLLIGLTGFTHADHHGNASNSHACDNEAVLNNLHVELWYSRAPKERIEEVRQFLREIGFSRVSVRKAKSISKTQALNVRWNTDQGGEEDAALVLETCLGDRFSYDANETKASELYFVTSPKIASEMRPYGVVMW